MAQTENEKPSLWDKILGVLSPVSHMGAMFLTSGAGTKHYELVHVSQRDSHIVDLREEEKISGTLTTLSSSKQASKIIGVKGIALLDKQSGEFGPMTEGNISDDSIRHARITFHKQHHYVFHRMFSI